MGKKEKEISKKNAEYYKEVNDLFDDCRENEFDIIQYENDLELECNQRLFDDVVNDIQKGLLQYSSEESLPLCEKLDLINLENFVNYLLCGCPATRKIEKRIDIETQSIEIKYPDIQTKYTIDEIESEIKDIKNKIIDNLGEDLLLNLYNKEMKNELKQGQKFIEVHLPKFRVMSIKNVGVFTYWKTVYSYGLKEYKNKYC
jgi:hypothetical protein